MTDETRNRRQKKIEELGEKFSKMLFLINGGALVAVFALMAQLYSSEQAAPIAKNMVWPAGLFLTGLLGAVFAVFWEMISLFPLIDKRYSQSEKRVALQNAHTVLRRISGICIFISIVTFLAGAIASFVVLM